MFTAKGLLDDPTAIKLRCDGELLQKLKEAANKSPRSVGFRTTIPKKTPGCEPGAKGAFSTNANIFLLDHFPQA